MEKDSQQINGTLPSVNRQVTKLNKVAIVNSEIQLAED